MLKKIKRFFGDLIVAYRLQKDVNYYQKLPPRKEEPNVWHNTRRERV